MKFIGILIKKLFGVKCRMLACAYCDEYRKKCTYEKKEEVQPSKDTCRHFCDKTV